MCANQQKIYSAYVSKHNSNREKQIILLMIANVEGWCNLAITKLLPLLGGIRYKHHGDFYCLNCLHSFATEKVCKRFL